MTRTRLTSNNNLRSQIGIVKKKLKSSIEAADNIDEVEDCVDDTAEDVFQDIAICADTALSIIQHSNALKEREEDWMYMIQFDPAERAVMDDYKARLGDWHVELKAGEQTIAELRQKYDGFKALHQKKSPGAHNYPSFPSTAQPKESNQLTNHVIDTQPIVINVPALATGSSQSMAPYPQLTSASMLHQTMSTQGIVGPHNIGVPAQGLNLPFMTNTQWQSTPPYHQVNSVGMQHPNFSTQGIVGSNNQGAPTQGPTMPFMMNNQGQSMPPNPGQPMPQSHWQSMPQIPLTLPSIPLPTFDGDFLKYNGYIELFSSMIDNHFVPDATKMYYLKTTLQGAAKSLIDHLPLTASNYQIARELLQNHYGDTIRIRHSLLRQLQDVPSVAHIQRASELQDFWTNISSIFHRLRNIQPECDNSMTADMIMRKLPKKYIEKLYTGHHGVEQMKASEVLDRVKRFIHFDTIIVTIANEDHHPERRVTTMAVNQGQFPRSPIKAPDQNVNQPGSPCAYCQNDLAFHRHEDCTNYKTVDERMKRAAALKLCFRCLRTGHHGSQCKRSRPCYHCKSEHHPAHCQLRSRVEFPQRHQAKQTYRSRDGSINSQHGRRTEDRSRDSSRDQYRGRSPGRSPHPRQQRLDPRRVQFNRTAVATTEDLEEYEDVSDHTITFTTNCTPTIIAPTSQPPAATPADTTSVSPIKEINRPVAMKVAELQVVSHTNQPTKAVVFFDSGSDRSYISSRLVNRLGIPPLDERSFTLKTFNSTEPTFVKSRRFTVQFLVNNSTIPLPLTETKSIIDYVTTSKVDQGQLDELLHDATFVVPRTTEEPDILIGSDYESEILGDTTSKRLPNGTTIHYTAVGSLITGTEKPAEGTGSGGLDELDGHGETSKFQAFQSHSEEVNRPEPSPPIQTQPVAIEDDIDPEKDQLELRRQIERMWNLEAVGIFEQPRTTDEELANTYFNATTYRDEDGRYVCRFPFKEDREKLPTNRVLAYHRLQSTLKRLGKDPELYRKYDEIIRDQIKRGFITIVDESIVTSNPVHYLSHHPVIKTSSSSTKVRIVYDASARACKSASSLNDALHTGETLLPQLLGVLLRIRKPTFLISSDIEKAFLMLGLHEDDQELSRFLWTPPGETDPICFKFLRVPFGVKSSPYLLNASIKLHLNAQSNPLAREVLRNIYVDNVFKGVETIEEGEEFYNFSKQVFAEAKMNLTQWMSNSPALDGIFASKERKPAETNSAQKLLGVAWNTETDLLTVAIPKPVNTTLTKRTILKQIASVYDPLGIIAPVVLSLKKFFQELWTRSTNWDAPLTQQEIQDWKALEAGLDGPSITLPRKYFSTPTTDRHTVELHIFGDASDRAYGSVAYLRRFDGSGVESAFVTAKTRLSPLRKALTIPQAELLAIERCAQLSKTVKQELDMEITSVFIWSDSMCSLDQVASNKASSVYGRNRLRKINQLAPDATFSHVNGKLNPADVLSRGCTVAELRDHQLWWTGPSFLREKTLPIRESSIEEAIAFACRRDQEAAPSILNLDPHRFSSFERMRNVIRRIIGLVEKDETLLNDKTKIVIMKLAQQLHPPDETTIGNLHLQLSNGLWYYEGRVPDRRVPYLPAHHIAKLFIQSIHRRFKHSSPLFTLAKVRSEVWIPKGVSYITKSIRECRTCFHLRCKPTYQPDFPNLPQLRTTWNRPFTFCGMDYAGPIRALNQNEEKKYWILLITCLTTRYTWVELAGSLDTDTLLTLLRRFCSQFGVPKEIRTDNGSQFTMLSAVTREAQKQMPGLSTPQDLPVFRFIPALSPWSGGMYERMNGLIKNLLVRSGTTRKLLLEEDLRTLLKEAESIINDRPLTNVSNDDIRPLRPVDFVFPNRRPSSLLTVEETLDPTPFNNSHANVVENWIRTSSITDYFIRRWKEEYVQLLLARNQTEHKQHHLANQNPLKLGSIVLVESEKHKLNWPLARVDELGPRSAKLFCPATKTTIERPYKKIYQMELEVQDEGSAKDTEKTTPPTRSARKKKPNSSRSGLPSSTTMAILLATTILLVPAAEATLNTTEVHASPMDWTNGITLLLKLMTFATGLILLNTLFYTANVVYNCVTVIGRTIRVVLIGIWQLFAAIRRRSRRRRTNGVFILIILAIGVKSSLGCNEIAHLTANEEACYDTEDQRDCRINAVSLLTVKVNGSQACLEIRNDLHEAKATLRITAKALRSYCQKRTVFWSRDFSLTHEYMKRCDSAGSCSITKCANLRPDEDIPELSHQAKSSPGYTGCDPGCGGWHCSCFYYDPSCLFYRYYAVPASTTVYEVFQCPTWLPRLLVDIELGPLKLTTELAPGSKFKLPNSDIWITTTSLSTPSMQVHTATFIAAYSTGAIDPDWTSYTFTPPSAPGAPAKGFTGELQCSDRKNAEEFNCKFDQALCKCSGFATEVNCQCSNQLMSDYKTKNQLPYRGINHEVILVNKAVVSSAVQETLVSLQIDMQNASLARITDVQSCEAKQRGPLTGCNSCYQGGKATLSCFSKKSAIADVHCGVFETSISCGPFGRINEVTIPSDTERVSLSCTVDCGIQTELVIEGKLESVGTFESNSTFYSSPYQRFAKGTLAFADLLIDASRFVFSSFYGPLIIVIVLIIVYLLFCGLSCLTWFSPLSLGRRRRLFRLKNRVKLM